MSKCDWATEDNGSANFPQSQLPGSGQPAFRTHLEGQLQLGARDDDVGEIQQVDLQRVKHALARDNDALGLLLNRQRPVQGSKDVWAITSTSGHARHAYGM